MYLDVETVIDVSEYRTSYYISCIASIVTLVTIAATTTHTAIGVSKRPKGARKGFIPFCLWSFVSTVISISYGFVRSSLITQQPSSTFSVAQCAVGLFAANITSTVLLIVVWQILWLRIFDVFRDTPYQVPRRWRLIFWSVMMSLTVCTLALILYIFGGAVFVLESIDSKHFYCAVEGSEGLRDDMFIALILVTVGLTCVGGTGFVVLFKLMLNHRLAKLQKMMVSRYIDENKSVKMTVSKSVPSETRSAGHCVPGTNEHNPASRENNGKTPSPDFVDLSDALRTQSHPKGVVRRSLTLEDLDHEISNHCNESAVRLKEINELIKKHDILAASMAISVMTYFCLFIYDPHQFWFLLMPCILSFHISLWLEFKTSEAAWKCCSRYGVCTFCYYRKNKEVTDRLCC